MWQSNNVKLGALFVMKFLVLDAIVAKAFLFQKSGNLHQ